MLIALPGIPSFCGLSVDLYQEYNHFVDCLLILSRNTNILWIVC